MDRNCDIVKLKEAVLADTQNPELWKSLATCLAENGQRRKALEAYRRSIALSGGDERVLAVMDVLGTLPIAEDNVEPSIQDPLPDIGLLTGVSLPMWFQVFLGLFSFLVMLMTSIFQGWTATDLVWSLWISSLVLGYSFIITAILAMFFGGQESGLIGTISSSLGSSSLALRLGGAMFMLAFFSFHFLFFHFVHSVFLNQFFPLVRSDTFSGMELGYFIDLVSTCIRQFWPFVVTSAISQLGKYVRAFQQVDGSLLSMPYKNVIRMHLSIFVFAFLQITGIPSIALYFVMFVYFFPMRDLWNFLRKPSRRVEGEAA